MTEMPKELKNSIIVGDCRERMKQTAKPPSKRLKMPHYTKRSAVNAVDRGE